VVPVPVPVVPVPVPVPVPVSVPVPVFIPGVFLPCGYDTPCPTDGNYYYCTAPGTHNDATNGCEPVIMGPFPATSCGAQCLTDPPAPVPVPVPVPAPVPVPLFGPVPEPILFCGYETPCPNDGNYFYCTAAGTHNDATNGCEPANLGPFPATSCGAQCLTDDPHPSGILPCMWITGTPCNLDVVSFYCTAPGTVTDGTGMCSAIVPFTPQACGAQCIAVVF
jgi:hypothetical protein